MDYSSAGVDIEAGDRFARHIASIQSPALRGSIGGFAGAISLDLKDIPDPVLLSTTDGVGTKLLVAERMKRFNTIGVDLVAMCVNDLAVCGAAPLQFLDYIACGSISSTPLNEIMDGIVLGCELAGCALSGGETAEMPDVYAPGSFDLAGFCTGVVSRSRMLPRQNLIKPGDVVYGIPSTGIHSNGLSLARKALSDAPEHVYAQLLEPTRIYVSELEFLTQHPAILAAAHITGGGLFGNLSRVLPEGVNLELTWDWPVPDVFRHIAGYGSIAEAEMKKVFNMGMGIAFVVEQTKEADFLEYIRTWPVETEPDSFVRRIGRLSKTNQD